ncbi:MAG: PAS domain S-box protein [Candidatus Hermodarchaeota archaeon]
MISKKKNLANKTEEEYRDIIYNLDVGFFRIGLDGKILNHNPKFNEIFGISLDKNLVGTISFDFWQRSEDRDKFIEVLKQKGYVKNYLAHTRKVTGEEIVVQGNSHIVKNEDGHPIATEGTIIDISDKYSLEQKLKTSEEKYRELIEFSPDIIFETDSDLNITFVNSIGFKKFGYTRKDIEDGVNIAQLIDPEYKEKAYTKIKSIFEGKKPDPDVYLLRKKDGTCLYTMIHSRPIIENKNVVGIGGTVIDINDRILAEQELKESEEKFRTIAEQSFMGIIILQDGIFKYFNEQARKHNGYSAEEINNWEPYEFTKLIHPEDKDFVVEQARKKEKGDSNVVTHHKYRLITKTGETRWLENYSKTITYEGKPANLIMSIDITDTINAADKIKESEEKYRLIGENTNDLIAVMNMHMKYEYVNKSHELLGFSIEEIYNHSAPDLVHPEDVDRAINALRIGTETTGTGSEELRIKHKDGTYSWFEVKGKIFTDKNQEQKALLISRDITERKQAEQNLKKSKARFQNIIENINEIIIVTGFDGKRVYTSPNFLSVFDKPQDELYILFDKIHPEDKENLIELYKNAAKKRGVEGSETLEFRVMNRYGKYIWFQSQTNNYIDEYGEIVGFVTSIREITEKKKAEKQLKESEEKYRSLFENMNAGFAYHEVVVNESNQPIDYIYHEVNPAFEKLTGMKKEELIGKRVTEAIPGTEDDPADWIGKFGNVGLTGIPIIVEDYSEAIDRWFKVSGYSPKKGFFAVTFSDITDQKKAEENLRESELKFSTIAEQSLLGIAIMQDDEFKYVNQKFANMGDRTVDEVRKWGPQEFLNIVHPEDQSKAIEQSKKRQLGTDTGISGYECRAFKKDGEIMWVQTYSKTIPFNGRFADLITILDITDRKLAEQELKESELKFRTIAEQSLMGICIIQDFEIKYVNQQMAEIYGYPLDEVNKWKPKEFLKVIHPDSREMAISQITKKQRGDTDVITHYIAKIITKNGSLRWVENYSTPISYQGKPADLLTQIDITSRMEAEQKIKTSEEKYHHLYENSPYAILLFNIQGEVIDCNYTSEILSGFKKEELVGMSFQNISFIPKDYFPTVFEDFKLLLRGKAIEPKEIQLYRKQGDLRWVSYHATTLYIGNERVFQIIIHDITDRKKAEKKLIESEEKYHGLFETSPNGVMLADPNGIILECNSAVENISGYSPDEFIGKSFVDLNIYQENGLNILFEGFNDLFGDQNLEYVELPIKHKDGHTVWIRITSSFITIKEQKCILTVIYDISTQKVAEEALKRSEEQYRDLLETSSVGVLELNVINGKMTYVNPKLLQIIGYNKEELTEEIFMNKLIHPKDLPKILRTNGESELEFRIYDKQNRLKWLSGKKIPKFNENNERIGIRIWLDDITEKKMYEELIYELNINFLNFTTDIKTNIELLLNTALKLLNGDYIIYAHKDHSDGEDYYQIITSENEIYSYDSKEFKEQLFLNEILIEGHDFPQIFFDIDGNRYADSDPFIKKVHAKGGFGKAIKSHDGFDNLVCVFYKKNPFITGQDKLVLFLICDAIEIEQRRWQVQKDLEEQNITLSKINKLKTELFSRTSHELKTPLISIKGFTELLLTLHKSKLDTETISILEEIKDGSKRLEKIINLLLESTKLEAGQLELNKVKEDMTFLINFCVKELKGLAKLRNQTILFDPVRSIEAVFDKERIYEVISNLLLNAVKYTPPGGIISIQIQEDNDSLIISVKDNGIGFTEEEKNQVFKQFGKIERYGQGWDVAIEGTGLGLYITRKLVELHDGKIWLESEGRNKGSTFFFSIPKE